jgi:hypothetical protein
VSAIDYSGTQVRGLAGLLARLRTGRPAPTIRAAALAPAAPPTAAGEAQVTHHIYVSDQPEAGQETTALGRYMADATILVPLERPEPGGDTRVINTYGIDRALANDVLEDPVLFDRLVAELGFPAYDRPVEPADLVDAARDRTGDLVRLSDYARPAHLGDA